jgi:histidine triad (HIT) family protein
MTIFTKIINGEIPCYKIAEDENYFAFLDIRPLHPGHTLVIPKKETDYIFDMEDGDLKGLIVFAKKIALAIQKAIPCERIGMTVLGLEVPHAHIHLSPINSVHDLDFRNARPLPADEMEKIAAEIRSFL